MAKVAKWQGRKGPKINSLYYNGKNWIEKTVDTSIVINPEAQKLINYIKVVCADAERDGLLESANYQDIHTVKATVEKYLPETISAYQSLTSNEDRDKQFIHQLGILIGALNESIIRLSDKTDLLNLNGEFLAEKFPDITPVTDVPDVQEFSQTITPEVPQHLFWEPFTKGENNPKENLLRFAFLVSQKYPDNTKVNRNIFGNIRSVTISFPVEGIGPVGTDYLGQMFEYTSLLKGNEIEFHRWILVRGVKIHRTPKMSRFVWIQELIHQLERRYPTIHGNYLSDNQLDSTYASQFSSEPPPI